MARLVMMPSLVRFVRFMRLVSLGDWEVDEFGILLSLAGW